MANQIIIDETRNQISVIEGQTRIVEVAAQGPQGPVGPRGETGPSGSSILNQITTGSVTASVDIGSAAFTVVSESRNLFYVGSSGNIGMGTTSPGGKLDIVSDGGGQLIFTRYGGQPQINIRRSQGTFAAPTAVVNGASTLFNFQNYNGTGFATSAQIQVVPTTQTLTDAGGTMALNVVRSGTTTMTNGLLVSGNNATPGSISITTGFNGPSTRLTIWGSTIVPTLDYFDIVTSGGGQLLKLFNTGNLVVGGSPDDAVNKLQVIGTTRLAGNTTITGSLLVTGNITAQTLVVQTITSSVLYSSGSNIFGNSLTNTQDFTGSVRITGSASITGGDLNISRALSSGVSNNLLSVSYTHPSYNSGYINLSQYYNSTLLSFGNGGNGSSIYLTGAALYIETQNVGSINSISRYHNYNTSLSGGVYSWSFQSSTAMVLNSNGNLLLSTTNDDTVNKLQVSGSSRFSGNMVITGSLSVSGSGLVVTGTTSVNNFTATGTSITLGQSQTAYAIRLGGLDQQDSRIQLGRQADIILNVANSGGRSIIFSKGYDAKIMQLVADTGNLIIQNGGTFTDTGERLQVSGSARITDSLVVTGSITSLNSIYSSGLLYTPGGIFCDNNLARFRHVTVGVNQGAGTGFIQPEDGTQSIGIRTGGSFGGTTRLLVTPTGNILINNTTDDTVNRLQVSGSSRFAGNMVISGSGATSATTGLQIQNSGNTNLFRFRNDGVLFFGNSIVGPLIFTADGLSSTPSSTIDGTSLVVQLRGGFGSVERFAITSANLTGTTTQGIFQVGATFAPTSGSGVYNNVFFTPTINQTGGANGITRGLYVNPTLTAAADWRSIEWSTNAVTSPSQSWGLYGAGSAPNYLSGSLLIGSTSNTGERLQVSGSSRFDGSAIISGSISMRTLGSTSATNALTIQNSATTTLLSIRNDGFIDAASAVGYRFSNDTAFSSINNGSFVTGYRSVATGNYSFSANGGMAGIGGRNQALGNMSAAFGRNSIAYLTGQFAHSSYGLGEGLSQHSFIQLIRDITGTSIQELFIDNSSAKATLPVANSMWIAKIYVIAVCRVAGGTTVLGDIFAGEYLTTIKRIGATTSIVGSISTDEKSDTSMSTSVVTIDADTVNNAIRIRFTPPITSDGTTAIRAVATLHLTELRY